MAGGKLNVGFDFETQRKGSVLEALAIGACYVVGAGVVLYQGVKVLISTEIKAYREERNYGGRK